VLGCPEVFDFRREYHLPESLARRTQFCGYVRRESGRRDKAEIRKELNLREGDPFVLVTAGGGEDSSRLMETYLAAVPRLDRLVPGLTSLVICGPELPSAAKKTLNELSCGYANVVLRDFTDDLMSYMAAADVVVSMGGYNTVCENLTLGKPAIVVPRVCPVEEQWIRAERMERLGLFRAIHPDVLTPEILAEGVAGELASPWVAAMPWVDLNALDRMTEIVNGLRADSMRPAATPARRAVRSKAAAGRIGLAAVAGGRSGREGRSFYAGLRRRGSLARSGTGPALAHRARAGIGTDRRVDQTAEGSNRGRPAYGCRAAVDLMRLVGRPGRSRL
jgi:predicted glycosyltransferase